jgi:ribosomal protein L16/L10AE
VYLYLYNYNLAQNHKTYANNSPFFLKIRKLRNKRNWIQRLQKKISYFSKKKHENSLNYINKRWSFNFGNSILTLPRSILFSALLTTRFILNLKKVVRKRDKTLRRYWITIRVFFKITKQSKGARMGKGKGKNTLQLQKYSPLSNFIEFKGVRYGRLIHFLKFFNSRFPLKLSLVLFWSSLLLKHRKDLFRLA